MTRACVIGAGFAGLALAIRLQSAGIVTTLVEAAGEAGGCARTIRVGEHVFDAGPDTITDPAGLAALWHAGGAVLGDDVTLVPVAPVARVLWPDGAAFDWPADPALRRAEVARFAPGDISGYEDLVRDAEETRLALAPPPGDAAVPTTAHALAIAARRAPTLIRNQAWRSQAARIGSYVRAPRLRELLAMPALARGANPFEVGGVPAGGSAAIRVEGGMHRLVAAMVALFEARGGALRLNAPVRRIHTIGTRAHAVECVDGWQERFDVIASGADLMATYRGFLAGVPHGDFVARRLVRRAWSPAMFSVHLALDGAVPGIAARTVLMPARFRGLVEDIFDHGVLPRDMAIVLNHAAGEGDVSLLSAHVPVANLAQLPIDWAEVAPRLKQRVLAELGGRLLPGIGERILASAVVSPADHAAATGAYAGSAWSLGVTRLGSLGLPGPWARAPLRDPVISNLYLVGAGTQCGPGIAAALASAAEAAGLIAADTPI